MYIVITPRDIDYVFYTRLHIDERLEPKEETLRNLFCPRAKEHN